MAITVGTNAYITSEEYEAYAAERGISVSAAQLDYDVIKSADFINTFYNLAAEYKLPGIETAELLLINKAALKAAELAQAGRLSLDYAALNSGAVIRERKKADVLEKEIEYAAGSVPTVKPRVPELDMLMRPFLASGNYGKLLV